MTWNMQWYVYMCVCVCVCACVCVRVCVCVSAEYSSTPEENVWQTWNSLTTGDHNQA